MVESGFFFYILVTIISYGIQAPLFIFYTRRLNSLIVTVYSRLSLVITMFPLLIFLTPSEIFLISGQVKELLLASVFGALGFIINFHAAKYIAVGIGEAIRQVVYVSSAIILGLVFLNETLPVTVTFLLIGILFFTIILTVSKSDFSHLNNKDSWKGFLFATFSGFCFAGAFYFFSLVSREVHPFVSTYFWMLGMGLISLIWLIIAKSIGKVDSLFLPKKTVLAISLISLTTITGTVSYAFAVNSGFFALTTGLATTSTLVAVAISWFLFKEKLSIVQISSVLAIIFLIFLLKVYV